MGEYLSLCLNMLLDNSYWFFLENNQPFNDGIDNLLGLLFSLTLQLIDRSQFQPLLPM